MAAILNARARLLIDWTRVTRNSERGRERERGGMQERMRYRELANMRWRSWLNSGQVLIALFQLSRYANAVRRSRFAELAS